jgi:hypothetical protein
MRYRRVGYVYPIVSSVVAVSAAAMSSADGLNTSPRAEGEVQLAAVVEDPILRLHIFRVDMREPTNAIVSLLGGHLESKRSK